MTIEDHPLKPFLPSNAAILFLGSFPPPRARWSMDFYYPNFINDFWRIMGFIHFGDAGHFIVAGEKRFDREAVVAFSADKGLAFYDTASKVRRLKDNASDAFLEIIEPSDLAYLLSQIPHCHTIVTTGGRASEEMAALLQNDEAIVRRATDTTGGKASEEMAALLSGGVNASGIFAKAQTKQQSVEIPAVGSAIHIDAFGRSLEWWRMPSTSRAYPLPLQSKADCYRRLFL